ncbi:MAG: transposase [Ktedonobacteraceae bacterium]|nr:transposase [Ktedonobacteraceae bacterium]
MKKRKKRAKKGESQTITKAVTHIRLEATNPGKLSALDMLAEAYLELTQQYTTLFCTDELPNGFRPPCFLTPLSQRWHRNAIQQAASIARSWRSNRAHASQDYLDARASYQEQKADGTLEEGTKEPEWREWNVPTLRECCIQANGNVMKLEEATDSAFDYWLKVSTLDKGNPLLIPVKLADYHKEQLANPETGKRRKINRSVTLNRRDENWWLTLTYDETIPVQTAPDAPVIGIDVGIANFVTTSDNKTYGSFNGKLRERQKRDREKRRRKAKLRKCLEKRGVPKEKLPSTTSRAGQRLMRHVKQEINRAVTLCFDDHEGCQFAYEQLSVSSMRFKARAQNAFLRASQLAHIPNQITWNATKRGVLATRVKSAYSSQECHVCHYVDRKNRPNQQTFCCRVCSHTTHADTNASENIASRLGDLELRACQNRQEIKTLLMRRHEEWKQKFRYSVVVPPVQLDLWACSMRSQEASTDVG